MCAVGCTLFTLPLGDIGKLCPVIVILIFLDIFFTISSGGVVSNELHWFHYPTRIDKSNVLISHLVTCISKKEIVFSHCFETNISLV